MEKIEIEEKIVAKDSVRSGDSGQCIRSWTDL